MYQDKLYGVSLERIGSFTKLIDDRKKSIVLKTMTSDLTFPISNGFMRESHYDDGNKTLIEVNSSCEVQIKRTQTKVTMKVYAKSDTRQIENLISGWRVKYFCRGNLLLENRSIPAFFKVLFGIHYQILHQEVLLKKKWNNQ